MLFSTQQISGLKTSGNEIPLLTALQGWTSGGNPSTDHSSNKDMAYIISTYYARPNLLLRTALMLVVVCDEDSPERGAQVMESTSSLSARHNIEGTELLRVCRTQESNWGFKPCGPTCVWSFGSEDLPTAYHRTVYMRPHPPLAREVYEEQELSVECPLERGWKLCTLRKETLYNIVV